MDVLDKDLPERRSLSIWPFIIIVMVQSVLMVASYASVHLLWYSGIERFWLFLIPIAFALQITGGIFYTRRLKVQLTWVGYSKVFLGTLCLHLFGLAVAIGILYTLKSLHEMFYIDVVNFPFLPQMIIPVCFLSAVINTFIYHQNRQKSARAAGIAQAKSFYWLNVFAYTIIFGFYSILLTDVLIRLGSSGGILFGILRIGGIVTMALVLAYTIRAQLNSDFRYLILFGLTVLMSVGSGFLFLGFNYVHSEIFDKNWYTDPSTNATIGLIVFHLLLGVAAFIVPVLARLVEALIKGEFKKA